MPNNINIAIVEDDEFSLELLLFGLKSIGYENILPACANYDQAIELLEHSDINLMLLDINLKGSKSGIQIAEHIRDNYDIPIIFISSETNEKTLEKVRDVMPSAFLQKPFKQNDLFLAIEIAVNKFNTEKQFPIKRINNEHKYNDVIFIKDNNCFHKVVIDEIKYISSEHVYLTIHTYKKKYLVRASMNDYQIKFDPSIFIRVHQRFLININKVDSLSNSYLGSAD